MNDKKKLVVLWVAFVLLLCFSLATLGWILSRNRQFRTNRQHPEWLLVNRLDFTPDQQTRYKQLRTQFEARSKPLQDSLTASRRDLFGQFGNALPDAALDSILGRMEHQSRQLMRLRFRHWQQVRALCTTRQQARFDRMATRLANQSLVQTNKQTDQ